MKLNFLHNANLPVTAIAFGIGLIVTFGLVASAWESMTLREREIFVSQSHTIEDAIEKGINTSMAAVNDLAALFNSTREVSADQFRQFSEELLKRYPFISSIQYMPKIRYEERGQFESEIHKQGFISFAVKDYSNDRYITSPPREQYFPVLYTEPFSPATASMMGFDLIADPESLIATSMAIDSGNPQAAFPTRRPKQQSGLTIFRALYTTRGLLPDEIVQRQKSASGLLAIQLNINKMLVALPVMDQLKFSLQLAPPLSNQALVMLIDHEGANHIEEDKWTINRHKLSKIIGLPGMDLQYTASRSMHWKDSENKLVTLSFIVGVVLTLSLVITARVIRYRTHSLQQTNRDISDLIAKRTVELTQEKSNLENEMRVRAESEARLYNQQEALLEMSTLQAAKSNDIMELLRDILEIAASTLKVNSIGVWLYNDDQSSLQCIDLFNSRKKSHTDNYTLLVHKHNDFFISLESGRTFTCYISESADQSCSPYQQIFNKDEIGAMLSIPIRQEGKVLGAMLIEHSEKTRRWALDEQNFASSVGDIIGLARAWNRHKQAESYSQKLSSALENTGDSVFITDAEGVIEYVNAAFETNTGYSRDEVLGKNISLIKSGKHEPEFYKNLWDTILSGKDFQDIFINQKKNGALYYEEKTITPLQGDDGTIVNFVSTGKDITERMQTQERLHFLAHHDVLTELPNRVMLIDRLSHAIDNSQRTDARLCLLFIDLDRFKVINDTLGHEYGDLLLKHVAERLRPCLRKSDTVARIGGDEFVVLLENIDDFVDVNTIASNILETLSHPFTIQQKDLFVNASIGISAYPRDGDSSGVLLRNADTAMYRAKEQGGNQFQYYTSEMSSHTLERLALETELRYALERKQFRLYYQPKVEIDTGRMIGAEALLRWEHPEFGIVSPVQFIPILEDTGMIVDVGEWVIRAACQQNKKWQTDNLSVVPIAVNLSARQFYQSQLADTITSILKEVDIRSSLLQLEITESVIMQNAQATIETLQKLHAIGIRFAIDDFGTGYSSLSYLKRFPIQTLKIDRTFVRDITTDPDDAAIVSTVIKMAHSLKMDVIAEGVETEEQANYLKERRCDAVQGFLFSRALPAKEFSVLLEKQSLPSTVKLGIVRN